MMADDAMDMLGRYRIDGRLGEGAMADVFRAHDPDIGRTVAIKVLKPVYRRDPALGARFVREARAAGALNHPNIATIYDVGEADGVPYLAMECVDGRPLEAALAADGRMPYERVLHLGAQLADALGYAHRQGVVHRDVKPSNILVTGDGQSAKLLDFGVARIGEVTGDDGEQLARTQAGQMIGTPRYMSPEQALGLPVDARSDLFSLGVVLYEMVTGKVAFAGTGLATLAIQIAQERVEPIDRSAADCPPGLRFIIDKLLAKKPDGRFASGEELAAALRRELAATTQDAAHPGRRGLALRFKLPLVLVAVTALALLASVSAILSRQQRALEHMAIVSGQSIATFVTDNAAVRVVDNAGLPADQQDWAPLQAFVSSAARDRGMRALVVVDAAGVVRAASDVALVGHPYRAATGEAALPSDGDVGVSAAGAAGLRFVRPIRYAGAAFGKVDLVLGRTALDDAIAGSRLLLVILALVVMAVVTVVGYLSGAAVAQPLKRLQAALDEAGRTGFALRLSHRRRDEFGAAFDAFNRAAAAVEPHLHIDPAAAEYAATSTRIAAPQRLAA